MGRWNFSKALGIRIVNVLPRIEREPQHGVEVGLTRVGAGRAANLEQAMLSQPLLPHS